MTNLTPAQKEAYARAHSSTVEICCLELRHTTFPAPLRVAQGADAVTLTLEANAPVDGGLSRVFSPLDFKVKPPSQTTEPDSVISISLTGASATVNPYLATANTTGEPIRATLRFISFDTKTKTIGQQYLPIHLDSRGQKTTRSTVTLQLGYTNAANRKFPYLDYTPESNPSLL